MNRLEFLAEVASLHYERGLNQTEIASQLEYSPSMISRLLTEARKQGVVEIRIHHPQKRRADLEHELEERLGLNVVRVMVNNSQSDPQMMRHLGNAAARLVEGLVHNNMTIGVGWGSSIYETINAIRPGICFGAHVIQMIGSIGSHEGLVDGQDLARSLSRALIGYYTPLPTPAVVGSEAIRDSLTSDLQIRSVFDQFKNIELAVMGVGTLDPAHSILLRAEYFNKSDLEELEQCGAVGDVCALYYDLYGNILDVPLTKRVVGIGELDLSAIPLKLGIAGGHTKVLPIIGAARAGMIDMLVTDELAAMNVLEIIKKMGGGIDA